MSAHRMIPAESSTSLTITKQDVEMIITSGFFSKKLQSSAKKKQNKAKTQNAANKLCHFLKIECSFLTQAPQINGIH